MLIPMNPISLNPIPLVSQSMNSVALNPIP